MQVFLLKNSPSYQKMQFKKGITGLWYHYVKQNGYRDIFKIEKHCMANKSINLFSLTDNKIVGK